MAEARMGEGETAAAKRASRGERGVEGRATGRPWLFFALLLSSLGARGSPTPARPLPRVTRAPLPEPPRAPAEPRAEPPRHDAASRPVRAVALAAGHANPSLPPSDRERLATAIVREASRNGLDPLLVAALVEVESGFREGAVSSKGAVGLMQLMPRTAASLTRELAVPPPRQPVRRTLADGGHNVAYGCRYLARLLRGRSLRTALVAYNMGPTAAALALRGPRSGELVRGYPAKVLGRYRALNREREALATDP
ncbi:MAG: lytic transglycosylase domain-containing protein [Deltaproteobacteria bacterium]